MRKKERIGIITLPLNFNYGGVLQAYALCNILGELGFPTVLLEYQRRGLKSFLKTMLFRRSIISSFINKYISTCTLPLHGIKETGIKCLIVGSDQVWRPTMSESRKEHILRYFLNTDSSQSIKKISYAASFGVDWWEYTQEETCIISTLLSDFSAISVREDTAIALCSQNLNIEGVMHVLDPTMLLHSKHYMKLMSPSPFKTKEIHTFIYVLDHKNVDKQRQIQTIINPQSEILSAKIEKGCFRRYLGNKMSIESWISSIFYSNVVITDSFHCCVFSILFHKTFYVIDNEKGGNTRIKSLLRLFELSDRFLQNNNMKDIQPINWDKVDQILHNLRNKSLDFLISSLNND